MELGRQLHLDALSGNRDQRFIPYTGSSATLGEVPKWLWKRDGREKGVSEREREEKADRRRQGGRMGVVDRKDGRWVDGWISGLWVEE